MTLRVCAVVLLAAVAATFLAGCPSKPKPAPDAGPDAAVADAGSPDAAGPEAANEGLVKRFDDETLVDHLPLTVKASSALATLACPKGNTVATLQQGTAVVQLAQRNGYYRVTFADEANPALRKMAWVAHFAFEEPVPPGKKMDPPRCPTTMGIQVIVVEDGKARCAYECTADRECASAGGKCEAAPILPDTGELPPVPTYTTVCKPPQAPGPDAGKPRTYFGIPHAGQGKCPKHFVDAPKVGDLCYRDCKVDTDCPEPATCGAGPWGPRGASLKLCSMQQQ